MIKTGFEWSICFWNEIIDTGDDGEGNATSKVGKKNACLRLYIPIPYSLANACLKWKIKREK